MIDFILILEAKTKVFILGAKTTHYHYHRFSIELA